MTDKLNTNSNEDRPTEELNVPDETVELDQTEATTELETDQTEPTTVLETDQTEPTTVLETDQTEPPAGMSAFHPRFTGEEEVPASVADLAEDTPANPTDLPEDTPANPTDLPEHTPAEPAPSEETTSSAPAGEPTPSYLRSDPQAQGSAANLSGLSPSTPNSVEEPKQVSFGLLIWAMCLIIIGVLTLFAPVANNLQWDLLLVAVFGLLGVFMLVVAIIASIRDRHR